MKYKMDFEDDILTCWNCGEFIDESGYLIEWEKNFEREMLCRECVQMLCDYHKNFKILAYISELS